VLFDGKSAADVLINLSANYKFCGFEILEGFNSHDVMKEPQIENNMNLLKEKVKIIF